MKFVKVLTVVAFAVALSASLALAADKPAAKQLKGKVKADSCCDKAIKKGETCAHKCCVAAAKEGNVCATCNEEKKK